MLSNSASNCRAFAITNNMHVLIFLRFTIASKRFSSALHCAPPVDQERQDQYWLSNQQQLHWPLEFVDAYPPRLSASYILLKFVTLQSWLLQKLCPSLFARTENYCQSLPLVQYLNCQPPHRKCYNLIFQIENLCFVFTNFLSMLLMQFLHFFLQCVSFMFTKIYLVNHLVDQIVDLNFCNVFWTSISSLRSSIFANASPITVSMSLSARWQWRGILVPDPLELES